MDPDAPANSSQFWSYPHKVQQNNQYVHILPHDQSSFNRDASLAPTYTSPNKSSDDINPSLIFSSSANTSPVSMFPATPISAQLSRIDTDNGSHMSSNAKFKAIIMSSPISGNYYYNGSPGSQPWSNNVSRDLTSKFSASQALSRSNSSITAVPDFSSSSYSGSISSLNPAGPPTPTGPVGSSYTDPQHLDQRQPPLVQPRPQYLSRHSDSAFSSVSLLQRRTHSVSAMPQVSEGLDLQSTVRPSPRNMRRVRSFSNKFRALDSNEPDTIPQVAIAATPRSAMRRARSYTVAPAHSESTPLTGYDLPEPPHSALERSLSTNNLTTFGSPRRPTVSLIVSPHGQATVVKSDSASQSAVSVSASTPNSAKPPVRGLSIFTSGNSQVESAPVSSSGMSTKRGMFDMFGPQEEEEEYGMTLTMSGLTNGSTETFGAEESEEDDDEEKDDELSYLLSAAEIASRNPGSRLSKFKHFASHKPEIACADARAAIRRLVSRKSRLDEERKQAILVDQNKSTGPTTPNRSNFNLLFGSAGNTGGPAATPMQEDYSFASSLIMQGGNLPNMTPYTPNVSFDFQSHASLQGPELQSLVDEHSVPEHHHHQRQHQHFPHDAHR
ncbi:hypothetical protein CANCADRAFT_45088 [Tortispora caseinolytica NRRL Y-17796]|uniref:Uncharacterized protein n=1 Tax=Tortispora caseinolytica NRRL Y-17796 TaxID=767744 RepID=A0A1E4T9W6_9ASCO|nr:hypothetical protein CANCADRAFT_45088 [Tortispora caseinolytica NRRL Y-17796]